MDFPRSTIEGSLPTRFEAIARHYAERPALRCDRLEWSYRDLNRCANLVVRSLPAPAADAAPVLLLLGHGALEIIALLAVLKSGHAYVALDPANPQARLAAIAADVGAARVITSRAFASRAAGLAMQVIELPAAATLLAAARDADLERAAAREPQPGLTPDALASLAYTSGSTGKPKGVMRSHRCSLHRCWLFRRDTAAGPGDRIAHMFSCSFAAAEVDVYGALLNGATLCCYATRERGFASLATWLAEERITLLHPPPAWWRLFLEHLAEPPDLPALRRVFLSGEPLFRRDVERMHCLLPGCGIDHRLSSSEASIMALYRIEADTVIDDEVIPVGHPVPDKALALLDADGSPVPPGGIGEIVVTSRYLSPGYWRQPELTASHFRPVAGDPCARRFHTGDFGRFAPDGRLHYLGRRDEQVKIRGYRVDLREIEAMLVRLEAVRSAAVVARPGRDRQPVLHAALVLAHGYCAQDAPLRAALAQIVPDYMIPERFEFLPTLPMTPTGKIDRMALGTSAPARPHTAVGALTDDSLEASIARIVCDVLGLEQVGRDEDFFARGGNSLRAAQVVARLARDHRIDLPLSRLFVAPTVALLAIEAQAAAARSGAALANNPAVPIPDPLRSSV